MGLLLCILASPVIPRTLPLPLPEGASVGPVEVIGRLTVTGLPDMDVTTTTEVLLDGRPVEWGDSRLPTPHYHIRLKTDGRTVVSVKFTSDP